MVEVYVDGLFKGFHDMKTPLIKLMGDIMSEALLRENKLPKKISFIK